MFGFVQMLVGGERWLINVVPLTQAGLAAGREMVSEDHTHP